MKFYKKPIAPFAYNLAPLAVKNNIFKYLILRYIGKIVLLFLFFCPQFILSQNPNRKYESHQIFKESIEVKTNDGVYHFAFYNSNNVETTFLPNDKNISTDSHAIIENPIYQNFNIKENKNHLKIDSEGIDVMIQFQPFQIQYFYKDDYLISEAKGFQKKDKGFKIEFNLNETETLMGGGARALGMNRRGHRLELYNQADYGYQTKSERLNFSIPVVLSSEKYLIHFDNPQVGALDFDSQNNGKLTYESQGGAKRYQIIADETWPEILNYYTVLTGRQPLLPRWALGNFSSRFGYHSQTEVLQTIDKFKFENIPVDVVILDLYWFGKDIKGTMGNLAFHTDSFPKPKKMVQQLAKQGVKTVLITEPFVVSTSSRWDEAIEQEVLALDTLYQPAKYDFYFGNTGLIDVFKPKAKDWFWNIYKDLKQDYGIHGWWGDLGEPEVHPSWVKHDTGSADEVHNIYGQEWAKTIYKGYEKDFPDERPFILMRAGYSGSQRYGMIPWSGDVSRSWGGLQSQPEISLQMGLQGLAFMHSDLGGFAGDLLDDDLYGRWLEYGVYQPIFRPHAQEALASEPVFRSDYAKNLAKKAIERRYKLLPYIYTLAFENSQTGMPLMRPLFFKEPDNFKTYFIDNQYLWGKDLLVCPILEPYQKRLRVYLPKTSNWYLKKENKTYQGGQNVWIDLENFKDDIPVFIREGAFIPEAKLVQTIDDYSLETIDLHYYFNAQNETDGTYIYHDDGQTKASFEKGKYEKLHIHSQKNSDDISIQFEKEIGKSFKSEIKLINLNIYNLNLEIDFVEVNGDPIDFNYNKNATTISVDMNKNNKVEVNISLK